MKTAKKIGAVLLAVSLTWFSIKTLNRKTVYEVTINTISELESLKFSKVNSPIKFSPLHTDGFASFEIDRLPITGKINTVQIDTLETIRVGGEFTQGTFCFAIDKDSMTSGLVIVPAEGVCYVMDPTPPDGIVTWTKRKLQEIACVDYPSLAEGASTVPTPAPLVSTQAAVPLLNSKPEAKAVLLLDFIGGKIQDPLWNGGKLIEAKPANYTVDQIKTTFDVTAERYAAFNVNVTTDPSKYLAAPIKSRMRVILTTTNFIQGYGGYAFISSLKLSGTGIYSPTVPCFAFVTNVGNAKNAGEVCAHELGHTFGLTHTGLTNPNGTEYYTGQGSWAPIMGSAYSKSVIQWSKGEYNRANNPQDALAIISSAVGVGYNTTSNSNTPILIGGSLVARDIISNGTVGRYFVTNVVNPGSLVVEVKVPPYAGLNTAVELRNENGSVIINKSNPLNDLNNRLVTPVKPGKYIIKVYGEGEGDPKNTGYSSYGSIGSFSLTANVLPPTINSGTITLGSIGMLK